MSLKSHNVFFGAALLQEHVRFRKIPLPPLRRPQRGETRIGPHCYIIPTFILASCGTCNKLGSYSTDWGNYEYVWENGREHFRASSD